jgi:di/tricarboxylate transporter
MIFAGAVDSVIELRKIRGLVVADDQIFKLESNQHERRLFEAVISAGNPVNGQSIRDARFRHRYNAVVLSVARNGLRLKEKVGNIILQPGDTLLLEAQKGFLFKYRNSRDFLLVSKLENADNLRHEKAPLALAIMIVMLVLIVTGVMNILQAALLAVALMLLSGCLNIEGVRRSIDYQLLLVIAGAFGLGAAVKKVGLATLIAEQALHVSGGEPFVMLMLVYLTTVVLTELVTNNAAAIIMFSIAINGAESLGVSVMPFAVAVMIAASASFITPIGYQTNLMVYGPGGYQYRDYLKLGLPLSILVAIVSLWLIPIFWPF